MNSATPKAVVWIIWGLLVAFAVIQILAWWLGGPFGLQAAVAWIVLIILALVATRRISALWSTLLKTESAHHATRSELEQLRAQNAMLKVVSQSVDVRLAFVELAQHITPLVPCDRVGIALLDEEGTEFQTYTARVSENERRTRPRPEVVFKIEGTAIGKAVRTGVPIFINDTSQMAADYLDVNILQTSGFASGLVIPLVASGRAVGTLNVVSRRLNAFGPAHAETLLPIAEIFAVAHVAQQLQANAARNKTMQTMTEVTVRIASEINGAVEAILGHCDLARRSQPDPDLQHTLGSIAREARQISSLIETMRTRSSAL